MGRSPNSITGGGDDVVRSPPNVIRAALAGTFRTRIVGSGQRWTWAILGSSGRLGIGRLGSGFMHTIILETRWLLVNKYKLLREYIREMLDHISSGGTNFAAARARYTVSVSHKAGILEGMNPLPSICIIWKIIGGLC